MAKATDVKLKRCVEWLQKQNIEDPKRLSQQNKNDIQFIIQTNADRKKFLLSAADDEASVPVGVDEEATRPLVVPRHRLRFDRLRMECEWQSCKWHSGDYKLFQKHVLDHCGEVHVIDNGGTAKYVCLWDVCGHGTTDYSEMVRHINYHAYHAHLLAIGFNGRATLKLERCQKDSSKRNILPPLLADHTCLWVGCEQKFNSIQVFFDHVKMHVNYADDFVCSWAGCGTKSTKRPTLMMHLASHTNERKIACYHCGQHFWSNRKLADHLRRQNVDPQSPFRCSLCNGVYATDYLLRQHMSQHISNHACSLCDMTAPSIYVLAMHVRYRHMDPSARPNPCGLCEYKAVTKGDLRVHMKSHAKKMKKGSETEISDEDALEPKKPKERRKYVCHMCPENQKIYASGLRLTKHLVKIHEAQWPYGHSRFRYKLCEDGMYRLITCRLESLEVSREILRGYSVPKDSISSSCKFNIEQKAKPTLNTPSRFEITIKSADETKEDIKNDDVGNSVEITMCDVDEMGNIINSEVMNSEIVCS